jgi:lysozyme
MITTLSPNGFKFIAKQEGLVLHPYLDQVGIATVGYGSTYYENGEHVKITDPQITLKRAQELFNNTSGQYSHAVAYWTKPVLTQNQFDALFSLVYNIGTGGFRKSTVLRIINGEPGDLQSAWYAWNKADGHVLSDLVQRRKEEYNLYIS